MCTFVVNNTVAVFSLSSSSMTCRGFSKQVAFFTAFCTQKKLWDWSEQRNNLISNKKEKKKNVFYSIMVIRLSE